MVVTKKTKRFIYSFISPVCLSVTQSFIYIHSFSWFLTKTVPFVVVEPHHQNIATNINTASLKIELNFIKKKWALEKIEFLFFINPFASQPY